MLALEALTPQQRAVLLLRDVFDYSVRETATCLGLSEVNVKTTHLRARRAMAAYDAAPRAPMAVRQHQTAAVLSELTRCLIENDVAAAEKLLSKSVRSISDGGGEVLAANVPVVGLSKVLLFTRRINEHRGPPSDAQVRSINGLPALVLSYGDRRPREASRVVFTLDVGADGLILGIHTVLATSKLRALRS
jgi:RNA polymerase sigma-70 factor (ECF subfamily)